MRAQREGNVPDVGPLAARHRFETGSVAPFLVSCGTVQKEAAHFRAIGRAVPSQRLSVATPQVIFGVDHQRPEDCALNRSGSISLVRRPACENVQVAWTKPRLGT